MVRCRILLDVLKLHFATRAAAVCPVVDGSAHIWDTSAPFPFPGGEPPSELGVLGSYDALMQRLSEAGASRAVIVQPSNYKFDHRYVKEGLAAYPDAFAGCGLLDPTLGPEGVQTQMEQLASVGFVSFRLNAALLADAGEALDGVTANAISDAAQSLNCSVSLFSFTGFGDEAVGLQRLVAAHPGTMFAVDHFGLFVQPATGEGDDRAVDETSFEAAMALAAFPNVLLKVSALFRITMNRTMELVPRLRRALRDFGSGRMLWGSDFPFVLQHGGIEASRLGLAEALRAAGATAADEEAIFCSTAGRFFFGEEPAPAIASVPV